MPAPGRPTIVESSEQFLALGPRWRELWARTAQPSPFNSWDFVSTWWKHFILGRSGGATGRMQTLVVHDEEGQTIGIVPMFVEHNMGQPALGTTLQPFGRSNSLETMTDEPMMIGSAGHENRTQTAIRSYFGDSAFGATWDLAVMRTVVPTHTPSMSTLMRWRGQAIEIDRTSAGPIAVGLPPSWDQFRSGLSKSMRDNIAYYPRRLQREVGPFTVQIARDDTAMEQAIDDLVRLHRLRSTGNYGIPHGDHMPSDQHVAFLKEALLRLARMGHATVATLAVTGQVIAAHAFLHTPKALWSYYSGFDPAWHRFSPLTIITAQVLRDCIERGAQHLYFSPVQAPWKARWGGKQTNQVQETSVYSVRAGALVRGMFRRMRWRAIAATPPGIARKGGA